MTDDDRKAIGPDGVAVAEALGDADTLGLERWGVTWPDPSGGPLLGRLRDGYWTPWGTAADLLGSARLGCDIAYRREPTQEEGDAHAAGDRECFVPMGGWTGRRCRLCGIWIWGGPTACKRCVAREERDAALDALAGMVRQHCDSRDGSVEVSGNGLHANADAIVLLADAGRLVIKGGEDSRMVYGRWVR